PSDDLPPHRPAGFQAKLVGQLLQLLAGVLLEHDLREARSVAQVDEHRPAVVASVVHPAEQHDLAPDVPGGQLAAGMGALQVADELGHVVLPDAMRGRSVARFFRPCEACWLAAARSRPAALGSGVADRPRYGT